MSGLKTLVVAVSVTLGFAAVSVSAYAQDKGVIGISLPDKTESRWITDTKSYNNGAKIVPTYQVKPVLVDQENWQSSLVDTGYYTQAQVK